MTGYLTQKARSQDEHGRARSASGMQAQGIDEEKVEALPAYLHIVKTISDRITLGVYPSGSRVPSIPQLCEEFAVSLMTIRRALLILADDGYISAEKGRGTFVRSFDLGDALFSLEQLEGRWLSNSAEVRLLSASIARADEQVAAKLDLSPGDRVVHLRRMVVDKGIVTIYNAEHIIYDPRRTLVESHLQLLSPHRLFEAKRGQRFPRGEISLRAIGLSTEAAEAMGLPVGEPALSLEHLLRDPTRRPVSWGHFYLRSELFTLRARLGSD